MSATVLREIKISTLPTTLRSTGEEEEVRELIDQISCECRAPYCVSTAPYFNINAQIVLWLSSILTAARALHGCLATLAASAPGCADGLPQHAEARSHGSAPHDWE